MKKPIVVMVTGSRKLSSPLRVFEELDRFDPETVIHGGATGADAHAMDWCKMRGRRAYVFFPDYTKGEGKRVPLVRNQLMLDEKPDLVLAFPTKSSTGTCLTWLVVHRAREMEIPTIVAKTEEEIE